MPWRNVPNRSAEYRQRGEESRTQADGMKDSSARAACFKWRTPGRAWPSGRTRIILHGRSHAPISFGRSARLAHPWATPSSIARVSNQLVVHEQQQSQQQQESLAGDKPKPKT